jgi:hypothetical protein
MRGSIAALVFSLGASLSACGGDDEPSGSGGTGGSSSGGIAGQSSGGTTATGGTAGQSSGGTTSSGGAAGSGGGAGASSFVPYFNDGFESYSDGSSLSGFKPFDAAGNTTASAEAAHGGKQSAKMEIHPADKGGFGKWGGVVPLKPELTKGQEVWVRLYVMWPASFQFTASPWMKFLRLHNRTFDGQNGGYNDLYVDKADSTTSVLRTIKEVHDVWAVYDGPKLPRDQWERYEMYLFIDDEPVDAGGAGRVRIWRDDTLIFDRTDVPTLTESGGSIDSFYLFTYWNNETPPDNYCYVDDLTIATSASPPPNTDAKGNRYIGAW